MCISSGCQVGKTVVILGNSRFKITSCNISENKMTTTHANLFSNSSITSKPKNSNLYLTLFLLYFVLGVIVVILAILITVGVCIKKTRRIKCGK